MIWYVTYIWFKVRYILLYWYITVSKRSIDPVLFPLIVFNYFFYKIGSVYFSTGDMSFAYIYKKYFLEKDM